MSHSKLSVTIPEDIHARIHEVASREKIKLSHLVTEALVEKLRRDKEREYIAQVNRAFEDKEIAREQLLMAEVVAENTTVDELPW